MSHEHNRQRTGDLPRVSRRRRRKKPASARELAVEILSAVDSRAAFSDRLLTTYLGRADLSPEDRSLLTQLVKGTLRWRGRIDWALSRLLKRDLDSLPTWIKNVLRLGAFQLLFMDRIPVSAATNESVKLARKRGHPGTAGLVNAVLRRLASGKEPIEYPSMEEDPALAVSVIYSHPEWIVRRWLARFGVDRTIRICEANNSIEWMCVRPNLTRVRPEELLVALRGQGIRAEQGSINPDVLRVEGELAPARDPLFQQGLYTPQDEAESLVCHLLSVAGGQEFLDLCAAPGGKATQIAEMTGDKKLVFCLEIHPARAARVAEAAGRLGLKSLRVVVGDGRVPPFRRTFGRILLDAPCSGLGVIGKRADARWRKKEESIAALSRLQRELLESAAKLLDKAGVLVYSVCSFEPEETTELIASFLKEHPELSLENALGFVEAPLVDETGAILMLPDQFGTDGVFAVRLKMAT
jgi:16S rRNA (cytosine967-C5)-methyltransferase